MDYFELTRIISNIFIAFLVISFIGVFLTFVVSSFQLLSSRGDKVKLALSKGKLKWLFVVLIVIIVMFAVIQLIEAYYGLNIITGPLPVRNKT